jgi:hypothetical protein
MRVQGADKLAKQFRRLPKEVHTQIQKTVKSNTESGARLARNLVPVASGELKGWIYTQYENDGMTGSIEAAPSTKEAQIKAKSVEGGRKNGDRGITEAQPYMKLAAQHAAGKFNRSIQAAYRKAARMVLNG